MFVPADELSVPLIASSQSNAVTQASEEPTGYSESFFKRTIWLPQPVSPKGEGIKAKLEDGLLKLWISKPNPEEERGHKITLE
jgi:HSP20 family molecular chaperone IbpA